MADPFSVRRESITLLRFSLQDGQSMSLGPAPAALSLLRGRHRRRFLVKGARDRTLQPILRHWLARVRPGKAVRIQVDVDPVSFL